GLRHEIYSLGFVDHVLTHLSEDERRWVGLGVLTHHRPLTGGAQSIKKQKNSLRTPKEIADTFGPVDEQTANSLATWLAQRCHAPTPQPVTTDDLGKAIHRLLNDILDYWADESPDDDAGLCAVLLQGAVTLADHVASAHTPTHHHSRPTQSDPPPPHRYPRLVGRRKPRRRRGAMRATAARSGHPRRPRRRRPHRPAH